MKKPINALAKWMIPLGASAIGFAAAPGHAAICDYVVDSEWNTGFVAKIRITNDGTVPIDGWNVAWSFSGDNRVNNLWNANLSGLEPVFCKLS